jgi:hypothetical protein
MNSQQSLASTSLTVHIVRGVIGFAALIAAVALIPVLGLLSLALAPIGLLALRGCPMCWAIGLVQTMSMGRLRRSCTDGRCELRRKEIPGHATGLLDWSGSSGERSEDRRTTPC